MGQLQLAQQNTEQLELSRYRTVRAQQNTGQLELSRGRTVGIRRLFSLAVCPFRLGGDNSLLLRALKFELSSLSFGRPQLSLLGLPPAVRLCVSCGFATPSFFCPPPPPPSHLLSTPFCTEPHSLALFSLSPHPPSLLLLPTTNLIVESLLSIGLKVETEVM